MAAALEQGNGSIRLLLVQVAKDFLYSGLRLHVVGLCLAPSALIAGPEMDRLSKIEVEASFTDLFSLRAMASCATIATIITHLYRPNFKFFLHHSINLCQM